MIFPLVHRPDLPVRVLPRRAARRAAALVIVLAFVVLMTGVTLAFFSSSLLYRQISNSSADQMKVDLFAQGAVDTIVGDLKQEIAAGSNATCYTDANGNILARVYLPANPYTAVPAPALKGAQSSVTSFAPNLVKRSAYQQNFFPAGADPGAGNYTAGSTLTVPLPQAATTTSPSAVSVTPLSRAANLSSTAASQNGRFISTARWNKPLLLPKAAGNQTNDADLTPDPAQFVAPDWVLVDRAGNNPTAVSNSVIGRYAYAIYDEGGLLDANVAGYPLNGSAPYSASNSDLASSARKKALAFADLTQLPGIKALAASRQQTVINALVGWRNFASAQASGSLLSGYTFPTAPAPSPWPYSLAVLGNPHGFLQTGNTTMAGGQSDRMFSNRQELMRLLLNAIAAQGTSGQSERANLQNALQYLGTFSRDVQQPSFAPAVGRPMVLAVSQGGNNAGPGAPGVSGSLDDQINPSFLNVRVPATKVKGRNDKTDLTQGDPLVKKRFDLNRLAWLTFAGPIASDDGTVLNPTGNSDVAIIINTLKNNYGLTDAFLKQGTAANIIAYFGLSWKNGVWNYDQHNGGGGTGKGSIMRVGRPLNVTTPDPASYAQDAGREPDFFELLKAAIGVGSLGKAITVNNTTAVAPTGYAASQVPTNYRYARDTSVDYQVIQIGANIIDQFDLDSLSTRIVFDDGSLPAQEFDGVENLPYATGFINGMLRVEEAGGKPTGWYDAPHQWGMPAAAPMSGSPGAGVMLLIPALWNPHDTNSSLGNPRPSNFRIIADSADPVAVARGDTLSYTKIYTTSIGKMSNQVPTFAYNTTNPAQPTKPGYSFDYSTLGHILTAGNTALTFSDSSGRAFREPTFLLRLGGSINLQSAVYPTGISSIDANPVVSAMDPVGRAFTGFILGTFPLRFEALDSDNTRKTIFAGAGVISVGASTTQPLAQPLVYLTYRVQYEYPTGSGNWVTYDTKYGRMFNGRCDYNWNFPSPPGSGSYTTIGQPPDSHISWSWGWTVDPRSARFGMFTGSVNTNNSRKPPFFPGGPAGWIDSTQAIAFSLRPDNYGGHYFVDFNSTVPGPGYGGEFNLGAGDDPVADVPFPQFAAGWTRSVVKSYGFSPQRRYDFNPGMLSQNNSSEPFLIDRYAADPPDTINDEFGKISGNPQPTYYADADGVVRRAMGAYVPSGASTTVGESQPSLASGASPIGLPMAITQASPSVSTAIVTDSTASLNQAQSRPLILNRPFQSTAELGYVFRDTPWKTLDFFTPESADTALLDVFCVGDTDHPQSLVAGRVSLNAKQPPVLAAIVSGAAVDDPKITDATVGSFSPTIASTVASALTARTGDPATAGMGPLRNVAEMIGRWGSPQAIVPSASYIPANPNGDLLLSSGYKDGKLSYAGFSGDATATTPAKDLSAAYQNATFSSTALQKSVTQVERLRTAPLRALASVGQTRVWSLLVDVVAQTGRYPTGANTLAGFAVAGEQRYWVHLTIDRFTGQVVDKQVEMIKE